MLSINLIPEIYAAIKALYFPVCLFLIGFKFFSSAITKYSNLISEKFDNLSMIFFSISSMLKMSNFSFAKLSALNKFVAIFFDEKFNFLFLELKARPSDDLIVSHLISLILSFFSKIRFSIILSC